MLCSNPDIEMQNKVRSVGTYSEPSISRFGLYNRFNVFIIQSVLMILLTVSLVSAQEQKILVFDETKSIEFPVITEYINSKLFEGDVNKVRIFIENRKQYINQLTEHLKIQLKKIQLEIINAEKQIEKDEAGEVIDNLNNKDINENLSLIQAKKERIIEIINDFKNIHYKHVNLLHELEDSDDTQGNPFQITKPYHISSVLKLNDYLQEIGNNKTQQENQIQQINQSMKKLSGILNDAVVEYTILLNKDKSALDLYNTIRNIYIYQAEYALLKLKNNKNQQKLTYTTKELDDNQKLLPKMILELVVTPEGIEALSEKLNQINDTYKKLQDEHKKLNKNFDKISFKAELELDNIEVKLKNIDVGSDVAKLQLQKQLHLHKIKYSYFIKNLLQQKELNLQIKRNYQEFNLSWLQAYENKEDKPTALKEFIKEAQGKLITQSGLQLKNLELIESLGRSTLEIINLQQSNKNDNSLPKKQYSAVTKQLDKNLKTIQRLSFQLNENNTSIQKNIDKNTRILKVLSQQFNKIEQIGQWFGDKFKAQIDKIKNILYYPITSFGDRPFTLAILLKVLLYLILGIMFLKFFRPRFSRFLHKRTKLSEGAAFSISTLVYYIGGLLVFLIALSASGYNLGQMMIVFGALGVGIGFGLQNIANNFVSGMILLIDRTLTVGDSVTLSDGTHGKVAKLAMRYTVIRTNGGYDIIVPNSELIANRVTSMTFDDNYLRIEIPFGVSYDADPEQVREITLEVANNVKHTINRESQTSAVLFSGFGDNSLDFILRVWVFIYDRYRPYAIKSDYYFKLFKAFKEAGIEIPFPQRDLHLKSIEKGIVPILKDEQEPE